ncbi:MAG: efflux RND transporter periplasmic adaptor subunit [Pirellulaceae bacterium]|nr:efflux RND transporter periplasmic adaptor subunit [Pirellulaceae bacterium]
MPKRILIPASLLLVITLISGGFYLYGGGSHTTKEEYSDLVTVKTEEIKLIDEYTYDRFFTGSVAPRQLSKIGFQRGGKVESILTDIGDYVQKGDLLATLEKRHLLAKKAELLSQKEQFQALLLELENGARSEKIEAALATVESLEALVQQQQLSFDRHEKLFAQKAISNELYDKSKYGLNDLKAKLKGAQSQYQELLSGTRPEKIAAQKAAIAVLSSQIHSLDLNLEDCLLVAPYSGILTERFLDEGVVVSPSEPLFEIQEIDGFEVWVGLPVTLANQLQAGEPSPITIGSERYIGTVKTILPKLDPLTRTQTVIFSLPKTEKPVVSGELARCQISVKERLAKAAFWVPVSALVESERGLWDCYSVDSQEDGTYLVVKGVVEEVANNGTEILVTGGFSPRQKIIVTGVERVVPGQIVTLYQPQKPIIESLPTSPK